MNRKPYRHSLILGSGEDVPEKPLGNCKGSLIIAADGGGALAKRWGLVPHLIIGDGDSLSPQIECYWQEKNVPFLRFPTKKDYTDIELAINYCLDRDIKDITIVGGWGSRIDHGLGNIELLYSLALKGIDNRLFTRTHMLSAFEGDLEVDARVGEPFSIIPLTTRVEGITTRGLLYPLSDACLEKGTTMPISNEAVQRKIKICSKKGVLLVILSNKIPLDI
ncbi:MAG: thiamine diphosphokinase [Bacillota bacterium]|nr:thiamine diphosphokinase [Bacillota bacterium]HHU60402.1 thiamine diphosphokinase [Natronincola sp.]